MLRDNRLLKHGVEVLETAIEELQLLESLPTEVWKCLSDHAGISPTDMRHKVTSGCHVSLAYLDKRVFSTLCALPWSLCIGDVNHNLEQLLQEPEMPTDVTSQKIWSLGRSGFDRRRLVQAIEAMRELSFTSHLTEKLHASAALVKRHHPDYGVRTTEMRAFVHTFRISCARIPSTFATTSHPQASNPPIGKRISVSRFSSGVVRGQTHSHFWSWFKIPLCPGSPPPP